MLEKGAKDFLFLLEQRETHIHIKNYILVIIYNLISEKMSLETRESITRSVLRTCKQAAEQEKLGNGEYDGFGSARGICYSILFENFFQEGSDASDEVIRQTYQLVELEREMSGSNGEKKEEGQENPILREAERVYELVKAKRIDI